MATENSGELDFINGLRKMTESGRLVGLQVDHDNSYSLSLKVEIKTNGDAILTCSDGAKYLKSASLVGGDVNSTIVQHLYSATRKRYFSGN